MEPTPTGRIAITGANAGIGLRAAAELAAADRNVIALCRDLDRADRAFGSLPIEHRSRIESVELDLASSASIRSAAAQVVAMGPLDALINNAAVKDFELSFQGKVFKIKAGTRIVTSIHALHQNEESWREVAGEMSPLTVFDPSRFLRYGEKLIGSSCFMPFGKGPRRCPGQAAGVLMVKSFLKVFVQRYFNCRMVFPENQTKDASRFHVYSKATFDIICDEEELPKNISIGC